MAEVGPAAQRGFLDISPGRRALSPGRRTSISPGKENQVPVLSLLQFSKPPFVTFGTVKLGSSRSLVLQIDNPTEEVEAEVSVDKINSSKGFSVDQRSFTIQPQGSFLLTVTWTPTEEGRARELILFSANGVLKHQAVVLGRAEGPRRKKKSLWDAIKAKKGEKTTVSSARKKEPPLKLAANKTFAVSRAAQYRRDQARSPLAALGAGPRNRARPGPADPGQNRRPQEPGPQAPRAPQAQNSPLVLLVPAAALQDPAEKPEGLQLLNRTLSPIGTPETFRRLMPHIRTPGLEPTTPGLEPTTPGLEPTTPGLEPTTPGLEPPTPGLTMRDALLLINSDLSLVRTSPGEPGPSCGFSGSLESRTGPQRDSGSDTKTLPTGPGPTGPGPTAESSGQRHTFLLVPPEDEVPGKKKSFTSATVTKSKAPAAPLNPSSGRKVKKSRRRLMEKTLELCDGSSPDSGPATPDLPVIDAGGPQVPAFTSSPTPNPVIFPVSPLSPRLHIAPPPGSVSQQPQTAPAPPRREEGSFPFRSAMKSKKRKSEEFLKSDSKVEDSGKPEEVKRSRGGAGGPERSRGGAGRPDPPRFQESKAPRAGSARSVTSSSSLKTRRSAAPTPGQRPSPKAAARGSSSVRASGCRRVKITKVVAVAQSKLTFVRPAQTALPRHPTPFAAKNMFYDERWMEKQERGFTRWLNYVLTPDDFKVNTEVAKVSAVSVAMGNDEAFSVPKAPTKEEMSFSTYTARRKLNRLRRGACQLFSSDAMATAIQRLELEVEARRLLVRTDRHLWKDIGERKKVLGWLVSYNPLWLRIGLETIFGELISLESNSDAVGLAVFILQRLLWNPDIAAQFRHPRVPNLYRDGHEEALSRFTLKKLLLLVCFLDKAKESRLIQHDPCLFCVDAEFKASRELLLAFSRDFLSGEGILPRHLAYLGLPVSHVQTPLDEFSFAVHNLAVDLRDGIRLVRVTELLVQDWTLSSRLRLPAISRLQKIHNVELALQVLRSRGVELSDDHGSVLDSRDVVDGHREKTLSLLWRIIFTFQVEVILDEAQLRDEVCFLNRTLTTRRRLESLRADRGPPGAGSPPYRHPSTKLALLMDWVRAVCDFYSLKVENFTVSFSDGRVLCYLLHHYHPGLVPEASVRRLTTQTVECSPAGRLELSREDGDSDGDSDGSFHASPAGPDSPSLKFKELLENEKSNFRLVNSAVSFLGGVPAMMNPADMCNTIPSERVVMSYLSFLCARLLDLRNETRAARLIQDAWRKYRLRKDLQLYQQRTEAAVKIQLVVRRFLQRRRAERQSRAAALIQAAWREYRHRNRLRLEKEARVRALQRRAATVIQARWRMFSSWKSYHRLRYYTVVVQAQWRMRRAAAAYGRILHAAAVLQQHVRARALSRRDRGRFLLLRAAALKLQTAFRRRRALRTQKENGAARVIQAAFRRWSETRRAQRDSAAARIQAWYRMQVCSRQYQKLRRSTLHIQALCRGHAQRRRLQAWKQQQRAAVLLQSCFRGFSVRNQLARRRRAAASIQRWFRASVSRDVQRREFLRVRRAAVLVQAAYRGKVTRESLKKQHRAATVIQAAFRRRAAQKKYLGLRKAATLVQRRFRATTLAHRTKEEYDALRNAALVLKAVWRGRAARKTVETWHQGATLIQAHYRRYKLQTEYRSKRAAAVVLQHHYRASAAAREDRKAYLHKKAACVALQAAFRGMKVWTKLQKKHQAATLLQSKVRMFVCRRRYLLLQSAAVTIQQRYRALVLCRRRQHQFRELQQAAVKLQAVFRGLRVRRDLKRRTDAATAIQAQFRMYKVRMSYLATKCAAVIVQERYRANKLRELQTQRYGAMRRAAVVLQAAYRGHVARRRLAETHRAAAVIQRKFLSVAARRRFLAVKAAALVCQRRYRALTLARKHRRDYLSRRRAAVCLQAAYRGHAVRKQLQVRHTAAVAIQAQFRSYRQRARYQRLHWACSTLQERYRARKDARTAAHALNAKRKAASLIQAAYRGMASRRLIQRKHRAAGVIQSAYRAHRQRQQFLKLKSSAVTVQQKYRAMTAARAARSDYARAKRAAVTLQRGCRAWRSRRQVLEAARTENRLRFTSAVFHHLAAVKIQRALRAHWALKSAKTQIHSVISIQRWVRARRERRRYLEYKTKVVTAQRAVRRWRARRHEAAAVIQRAARKFLLLRRQQRVERGIVKAQALWRGHRSRRLNDNPKTVKLRRRLHRVSAEVKDDDRLCNKTASALGFLLRYKHFSYILEALKNLEIATRLLPECCERLVESGATNVIFTLIRSCNRSVPCMDVITYSIQILLNLSKYHKTVEAVYAVENSVETLLDLLQRYREKAGDKVAEKGGSIFTKACFLLALLVQDRRRAQEVKQLPKALERLRSIYRLTGRKHKMDAERSVIKQKQNASVNGSFFVPATPRKSRPPPKFAPDWVLRKDKFRDIVDPLRAIQMLAETLGV